MIINLVLFATLVMLTSFIIVKITVINTIKKDINKSPRDKQEQIKEIYKNFLYAYAFLLFCSLLQ